MINKREIMSQAAKYSLPANTIEKDYILNWLLAGIANASRLRDSWIFKGGTCLKKCYFENYRFSEDLDFTLTDSSQLNEQFLLTEFGTMSHWVYDHAGIEFPVDRMRFEVYQNPRKRLSVTGKIAYQGPMQRRGNQSTVKLDLTGDELIVRTPVWKKVYHPYSDLNLETFEVLTYSIEEIFSEKLRAFVERMRPRDLYDIIHLYHDKRWSFDNKLVMEILKQKCQFKNVKVPTLDSTEQAPTKSDLIVDWDSMLAHQIYQLAPYDYYWDQLPALFAWLYGNSHKNAQTALETTLGKETE